jgi:hypothetical protein
VRLMVRGILVGLACLLGNIELTGGFVRQPSQDVQVAGGSGVLPQMEGSANFGKAIATLQGNTIAVGQEDAPGGGVLRGDVWIITLGQDFQPNNFTTLGVSTGLQLRDGARFGASLATLSVDQGDGSVVLAVGSCEASCSVFDGTATDPDRDGFGSVYILKLSYSAHLLAEPVQISSEMGGFEERLQVGDIFGRSLAAADVDGDGRKELFVGANTCPSGSMRAAESVCRSTVSLLS